MKKYRIKCLIKSLCIKILVLSAIFELLAMCLIADSKLPIGNVLFSMIFLLISAVSFLRAANLMSRYKIKKPSAKKPRQRAKDYSKDFEELCLKYEVIPEPKK